MRLLIIPIAIGTVALAGALPAAAQPKPTPAPGTSVGAVVGRDRTAERRSYTLQAQHAARIWQQRLQNFDAKATMAEESASKNLHVAWTETKTASSQLETVAEGDWESAKTSYRTATDRLSAAWHKANPAGK